MNDLIERRRRLLGPNVPTFYETPVHIVRGEGVWLWDVSGRRYLDCYNNVAHVGIFVCNLNFISGTKIASRITTINHRLLLLLLRLRLCVVGRRAL